MAPPWLGKEMPMVGEENSRVEEGASWCVRPPAAAREAAMAGVGEDASMEG